MAANIDVAFIVQSCHFDFNVRRLERYLVMTSEGHIEPVVLLTKTDLIGPEVLEQLISKIRGAGIGTRIISLSNVSGNGIDQLRELIEPGKTYCLLGSSGVGKTTLVNRLTANANLATKAVSNSGEGRHTTTRRQLIMLESGGFWSTCLACANWECSVSTRGSMTALPVFRRDHSTAASATARIPASPAAPSGIP